jgi:hypothetical protein
MQRSQRPELFGYDQRRVVGQHDPAGADPDGARAGRDVRERDRGGGAGDARHVVVLGHPEAPIAQRLGTAREVERVPQRLAGVGVLGDGGEVEDGEGLDHAGQMGTPPPS